MIYKIPVSWEAYTIIEVEADSLKDAIESVTNDSNPLPDGDYVDGSFQLDWEILEDSYEDEIEWAEHYKGGR